LASRRRRRGIALSGAACAAVLLLAPGEAVQAQDGRAQDWPSRPVTLVVPYEAGGIVDLTARLMAEHMGKMLPQPFVIENRAGAGGTIGTQHVARSKPDGHTLLVGSVAQIAIAPLIQEVKYDPLKDFAPVSMFSSGVIALAVNAELAAMTTATLIAHAKANAGKLAYSSAGFGSFSHLGGAMLAAQAGLELLHVPYKGAAPAVQALLAGQVQVYVGNFAELHPLMQTGKIRILATATRERLAASPELPTIAETLPGFQMAGWQGLLAPAQTPKAIIVRLEQEAIAAARSPSAVARLKVISVNAVGSTTAEFAESIDKDLALYRQVTKAAGLQK
jgi:tripartite-type tricarboxylate transporter receptor subunit TctC